MTEAECVNSLAGITHAPLGRGPDAFDCWGLVCEVCKRMDWPVPFDPVEASECPQGVSDIFATHYKAGQWVDEGPVSGAVVFFGSPDSAYHAGIIIAGAMLEISSNRGLRHLPVSRIHSKVEFRTWLG